MFALTKISNCPRLFVTYSNQATNRNRSTQSHLPNRICYAIELRQVSQDMMLKGDTVGGGAGLVHVFQALSIMQERNI